MHLRIFYAYNKLSVNLVLLVGHSTLVDLEATLVSLTIHTQYQKSNNGFSPIWATTPFIMDNSIDV